MSNVTNVGGRRYFGTLGITPIMKPVIKPNQKHMLDAKQMIGQPDGLVQNYTQINQMVKGIMGKDNTIQEIKNYWPSLRKSSNCWKNLKIVKAKFCIQNQIYFDSNTPLNVMRFLGQSPCLQTRVLLAILMMDTNAFDTTVWQNYELNLLMYSGDVGSTFTEKMHTDSYIKSCVMGIDGQVSQTHLFFMCERFLVELPVKRDGSNEAVVFPQRQWVSFNKLGVCLDDISMIWVRLNNKVQPLTRSGNPKEFERALEGVMQIQDQGIVRHSGLGDSNRIVLNVSKDF